MPVALVAAIEKAAEHFLPDSKKPTDEYLVRLKKVLTPIFMNVRPYDEGNGGIHNLSVIVLATPRYVEVFNKGLFVVPPVVPMYDDTIPDQATQTVVKKMEMAHEGKLSDCAIYEAGNKACLAFIMDVVDRTWYATLEHA